MLHWFDEAQFDEAGNFVYTYSGLGDYIGTISMIVGILILLVRFGFAFRSYIYTGEFGRADRSLLVGLMEDKGIQWKYILTGHHPGGIAADSMVVLLGSMMVVFFWGVYLVAGLVILLAHIMRKRIAHKQTFINNLKGEQIND